eukprot:TRINITY_DN29465_c0_g1_i1.p1 TRINITY_DN29465_c0_g1~~TRINITY_DN29465_c0_g1_i1.p1  ORF type:complete len:538 (-),score=106.25 TRINITY_DN29465_c0_g1_i1:182-1795(-)
MPRTLSIYYFSDFFFFFQAEDGIRDAQESRGLGDVYKRQMYKLLLDENGGPGTLTADGGTIAHAMLRKPASSSPAARLALAACAQQAFRCSDGVCTLALLGSELLTAAERLLGLGLGIDSLVDGLALASDAAAAAVSTVGEPLGAVATRQAAADRIGLALQADETLGAAVSPGLLPSVCEVLGISETCPQNNIGFDQLDFQVVPGIGEAESLRGVILRGTLPIQQHQLPSAGKIVLLNRRRGKPRAPVERSLGSALEIREAVSAPDDAADVDAAKLTGGGFAVVVAATELPQPLVHVLLRDKLVVLHQVGSDAVDRLARMLQQRVWPEIGLMPADAPASTVTACRVQRAGASQGSTWTELEMVRDDGTPGPMTVMLRHESASRRRQCQVLCHAAVDFVRLTAAGEDATVPGAGSVELTVIRALAKVQAGTTAAHARVLEACGAAFRGYLRQLLANAGRVCGHEEAILGLEAAQDEGQMGAGFDLNGNLANAVLSRGKPVRDLVSAKVCAIRGAIRLVCDIVTVDCNLPQSQPQKPKP